MINEIITTLHPDQDPDTNLYPNIKKANIPNKSIDINKVGDDVKALLDSINELHPSGVDTSTNILAFKNNKGIWIGSDTGHWYYWDGTQYTDGGVYQATAIDNYSIDYSKINTNVINKFHYEKTNSTGNRWPNVSTTSGDIPNSIGDKILFKVNSNLTNMFTLYGKIGSSSYNLIVGYQGKWYSVELTRQYDYFEIIYSLSSGIAQDEIIKMDLFNLSNNNLTSYVFNNFNDLRLYKPKVDALDDLAKNYIFNATITPPTDLYPAIYIRNFANKSGDELYIRVYSEIKNSGQLYGYIGSKFTLLGVIVNNTDYKITLNNTYDYFKITYPITSDITETKKINVLMVNLTDENLTSEIFRYKFLALPQQKNPNVLIIGDSYSQMGNYVTALNNLVTLGNIVNLGVGSATLKDKYTDRETYPYTDNPMQSDNTGNHNTFACQIEKLKSNFNTYYSSQDDYPSIILIQGGNNDGVDGNTNNYINEIYESKNNVYYSIYGNVQEGNIVKPIDYQNTNRTNFCGAMKYLKGELHTLFPNAIIIFITNSRLGYANSIQYSYKIKSDQMVYASSLLSTPIINWANSGFISFSDYDVTGDGTENNPYNITGSSEYTNDGMHPNNKGSQLLAMIIAKELVGLNLTNYKN